jgi:hypothetical protein
MEKFELKVGQLYTREEFPENLRDFINDCSAQGAVDDSVSYWKDFFVADEEDLKSELAETGAWDNEELEDYEDNLSRYLWLLASSIKEEEENNY